MIVDGRRAIISAAYFGRQYDIRPIAGINTKGVATNYEMKDNASKGNYEIKMKVRSQSNTFDVNITIGKNGYCSASISAIKIDFVRYTGRIVPLTEEQNKEEQNIEDQNTISI